jgi:hypothetical protein
MITSSDQDRSPGSLRALAYYGSLSDGDRKRHARAVAERKKVAIACAKKLEAAADALLDLMRASSECDDGSGYRGADDGRLILQGNMREFANWLDSVYGSKDGGAR